MGVNTFVCTRVRLNWVRMHAPKQTQYLPGPGAGQLDRSPASTVMCKVKLAVFLALSAAVHTTACWPTGKLSPRFGRASDGGVWVVVPDGRRGPVDGCLPVVAPGVLCEILDAGLGAFKHGLGGVLVVPAHTVGAVLAVFLDAWRAVFGARAFKRVEVELDGRPANLGCTPRAPRAWVAEPAGGARRVALVARAGSFIEVQLDGTAVDLGCAPRARVGLAILAGGAGCGARDAAVGCASVGKLGCVGILAAAGGALGVARCGGRVRPLWARRAVFAGGCLVRVCGTINAGSFFVPAVFAGPLAVWAGGACPWLGLVLVRVEGARGAGGDRSGHRDYAITAFRACKRQRACRAVVERIEENACATREGEKREGGRGKGRKQRHLVIIVVTAGTLIHGHPNMLLLATMKA